MTRLIKLFLILLLLPICTAAGATCAFLSGPTTAESGDTVTLTLSLQGDSIYGISGSLRYDDRQITCTDISPAPERNWLVETNAEHFLAYSNDLQQPVNDSAAILVFTFQIAHGLSGGTAIRIVCEDLVVSDMVSDTLLDNTGFCVTVTEHSVVATEETVTATQPDTTEPTKITETIPAAPTSPAYPTQSEQITDTIPKQDAPTATVREPLWTYMLFALACICVGIGAGILIQQRFFQNKTD